MTDSRDHELPLVEEVAAAWRPVRPDVLGSHPAWHDLSEEGRTYAFEVAQQNRVMEASLDPDGFNHTVHAVLSMIRQS